MGKHGVQPGPGVVLKCPLPKGDAAARPLTLVSRTKDGLLSCLSMERYAVFIDSGALFF
jgi:hypothetical protein